MDILTYKVNNIDALLAADSRGTKIIQEVSSPRPSVFEKKNVWYEISMTSLRTKSISIPAIKDELNRLSAAKTIYQGEPKYISRFRLLKPLPLDEEEIKFLANSCYERALRRHQEELNRHDTMLSWATGKGCLAARLAAYFDDTIPGERCENCQFCLGYEVIDFGVRAKAPVDHVLLEKAVNVCGPRHNLQFIARFAAGVTSPRIKHQGLHRHKLFGCLLACTFEDIMDALQGLLSKGEAKPPWEKEEPQETKIPERSPVEAEQSQETQSAAQTPLKLEQRS